MSRPLGQLAVVRRDADRRWGLLACFDVKAVGWAGCKRSASAINLHTLAESQDQYRNGTRKSQMASGPGLCTCVESKTNHLQAMSYLAMRYHSFVHASTITLQPTATTITITSFPPCHNTPLPPPLSRPNLQPIRPAAPQEFNPSDPTCLTPSQRPGPPQRPHISARSPRAGVQKGSRKNTNSLSAMEPSLSEPCMAANTPTHTSTRTYAHQSPL